ncbi:MAG TPA: biopolymer transporter ExbD [Verrucomicrobiae bacterium]|jgi:biopolymer transport protein ExbD|nr:biopolymer transporter ExbD [Verrucomicrobiae bacterium]
MARLDPPEYSKRPPTIQIAPLVDIAFITLIFFMTMSVFNQLENELSINVPKAKESKEMERTPGEIVINVDREGAVVVNQKKFDPAELEQMLKRLSSLYPNQPVIIRADAKTTHEHVIRVLDACAGAGIWNIAFATSKEEKTS